MSDRTIILGCGSAGVFIDNLTWSRHEYAWTGCYCATIAE